MSLDAKTMGTQAEMSFVNCMSANGVSLSKSSNEQDKFEHWDFLVNDQFKVEVKSRKIGKSRH